MFICTNSTYPASHRITSFNITSSLSPNWSTRSVPSSSQDLTFGLVLVESEQILYHFGKQGSNYLLSKIKAGSGAFDWIASPGSEIY